MDLQGIAAVVTGGATGMGSATATALTARGARVAVLGRRLGILQEKAREINGVAIQCDLADPESVDAAINTAESELGSLRILVNPAADGGLVPLLNDDGTPFSRERIRAVFDSNLLGTFWIIQAFASRLSQAPRLADGQRGVVITVSSIGALDGVVGASYAASKAGVNGATLSLARELSMFGIRVMTIAPGGFDTEMLRENTTQEICDAAAAATPFPNRLGKPEEFAATAVHICENDFLNGSIIRIDGAMRMPFVPNLGGSNPFSAGANR